MLLLLLLPDPTLTIHCGRRHDRTDRHTLSGQVLLPLLTEEVQCVLSCFRPCRLVDQQLQVPFDRTFQRPVVRVTGLVSPAARPDDKTCLVRGRRGRLFGPF